MVREDAPAKAERKINISPFSVSGYNLYNHNFNILQIIQDPDTRHSSIFQNVNDNRLISRM